MRAYQIKRGVKADLKALMKECFGEAKEKDGKFTATYGPLKVVAYIDGKSLMADYDMPKDTDPAKVLDIVRRRNIFLEKATGFTAKDRLKQAKKEAEKSE